MLKNLTKHIPFTTLIIVYFFICGALHIISFWTLFKLDITPLISIADIPKSFIIPFIITQGFGIFINIFIQSFFLETAPKLEERLPKTDKDNFFKSLIKNSNTYIFISFVVLRYFYIDYSMTVFYWYIVGTVSSILVFIKLANYNPLTTLISGFGFRYAIISLLVFLPIMSFIIGRTNAINIYNNKEIKIIKTIKADISSRITDTNSLKFLGFLGDKVICSSLDNKKIIFINQSSFDRIEMTENK